MKGNGEKMRKWREERMRKQERLAEASAKRERTLNRLEAKKLQTKITETLKELPRNRRILLEGEMEKERRMTLREAKQEVWKKWRQSKGRRKNNPKTINKKNNKNNTNEELEAKLEKIEMAVQSYKSELENMKKSEQEKASRLERKRRLESHWEMLRWITSFMEENETKWTELKKLRRQEREEKERKEEWESRTREEKMSMIKEEEAEKLKSKMTNKEGRLEEAQRLKRSWRECRGASGFGSTGDH